MSTTRSQKRRNNRQESTESVSECLVSPIVNSNDRPLEQDIDSPGPSGAQSPRIENSTLERLRASLKDEITSELKNLLVESQKEILMLLIPNTGANNRDELEEDTGNETRSIYTSTKSLDSTQNHDPCSSRNILRIKSVNLISCRRCVLD